MKQQKDYLSDIAAIRSMMERSSKFLSLSGWSGILAGSYAMAGSYIAGKLYGFQPEAYIYAHDNFNAKAVVLLAIIVLALAIATAIADSDIKARKRGETAWNGTSRRMLIAMAVPLITGAMLCIIFAINNLTGLILPATLIFYGLSLYIAGYYTYTIIRTLGLIQIALGVLAAWFIGASLLIWAAGFGILHILYGLYMFKFKR